MRRKRFWIGLNTLALLVMLAGLLQAQDNAPVFEYDDCPFPIPEGEIEGETLECGYLIVPETRGDPESADVDLAVAILYSPSPDAAPDPLIYLAGGPGGSAVLEVERWVETGFRARRDIILIDQRGTGYSYPRLNCGEINSVNEDAERDCYRRLTREGIDLSAYNSVASAADIADLRLALGLEAVNLYGVSYGTRLALIVMRDHPEGIRSVVLDSVFPPEVADLNEEAVHGSNAILRLFDSCAQDSACAGAYGDLEATFFDLVDDLNAEPVVNENGDEVTGDQLVSTLFEALYLTPAIPTLPYAIALLDAGDFTTGLDMLAGSYSLEDLRTLAVGDELPDVETIDIEPGMVIPDGDSEGMYHSVECNEEVPFASLDAAEALAVDVPPPLRDPLLTGIVEQLDICAFWDSGRADPVENTPVSSDIPTLILTGSFDPVTPPVWGQAAARHLSRSTLVEVPYAGHSLLDSGECPLSISEQFLDDPGAPLDTACVGEIPLEFYVPQTCVVTAIDTALLYDSPGAEASVTGELAPGAPSVAQRLADDGDTYWFGLPAGGWVDELSVETEGDCYMLPLAG